MNIRAVTPELDLENNFQSALRDTVPVAMGYFPLGTAYGMLLVNAGVDWYWPALMSIFVFAGALQFLSVNFIALGVPLWEVVLTSLIVNFRHVFYGFSFPIDKIESSFKKCYGVFALTDETYSLLAGKDKKNLNENYIFYVQILSHLYWILGSTLGALASMYFMQSIQGLDFALTALFVVLAQEHFYRKEMRKYMLLGGLSSLFALIVLSGQFLTIGMGTLLFLLYLGFRRSVAA